MLEAVPVVENRAWLKRYGWRGLVLVAAHGFVLRPVLWLLVGARVIQGGHLKAAGTGALVMANHNSHLDALLLMSLFALKDLPRVQPVAAADYFFTSPVKASLARLLLNALPLPRRPKRGEDPLLPLVMALETGQTLILFPEGSRGEPERLGTLKTGLTHLLARLPHTPVVPLWLRGAGRVLPRGELIPLPLFVTLSVGAPFCVLPGCSRDAVMTLLRRQLAGAARQTVISRGGSGA